MKQFFKFTFASCLGSFVALAVMFFFVLVMIGSLISLTSKSPEVVEDNSVLVIKLDKPIYDREVSDISSIISSEGLGSQNIGLTEFLAVVNKAKNDNKIKAILLDVSTLQTEGYATAGEMREALESFKLSGKNVYAYSDMCDQKSYYLASVADKIMINPAGMVMLSGLGGEVLYLKDLMNKFDIDVDLVRPKNNAFKSAGEMYTNSHMTDSNRVQMREYLNSIWNVISAQMAKSRGLNINTFNEITAKLDGFLPEDACKNKIVDYVGFKSDFKDSISNYVIADKKLSKKQKIKFISYNDYRTTVTDIFASKSNNIAVVYAYGSVNQGKGSELTIGSESICKAIEKAAKDDNIKAIVLRVNSTGGDAVASELITNEVIKAKKKKPVIVSMGDYAASAGYEMSSNATYIVANQTSVTGSIGVFGVMPNFSRSLKKNLGINFDTIKTHANSNPISVVSPMTTEAKTMMQNNVERFYTNFINRVATGRGKSTDYINSIARGRVWSGVDAKARGLVDEFGGLNKAIEIAAKKAGIQDYGIIAYPTSQGILEQLLATESQELRLRNFTQELGKPYSFFLQLRDLTQMQGVQMRMDYLINF